MYLSRVQLRPELGATQLQHLLNDRKGYGLHRLFWGLFSDGNVDRQKRNFLFREERAAEQLSRPGRLKAAPVYFVLSPERPTGNKLFEVESKPYQPNLKEGDRLSFKLRVNAVVTRGGKRHDIVMDAQNRWLNEQLEAVGQPINGKKSARKQRLLDYAGDLQLTRWREEIDAGIYRQKLEQQMGRTSLMEWAIKTTEATRVHQWWERQGEENHGFEITMHPITGQPLLEFAAYNHHPLPEKEKRAGFSSIDLSGEITVTEAERFTKLLMNGIGPAKAFGCGLMLVRRI